MKELKPPSKHLGCLVPEIQHYWVTVEESIEEGIIVWCPTCDAVRQYDR